jgi:vacuolar-type H+-ATPase subunit H
MQEVMQKVMAAEAEAKRRLDQANAEANRILAEARRQAAELHARARAEAAAGAAQLIDSAARAAAEEERLLVARAANAIHNQVRLDPATRQAAVDALVQVVAGTAATTREPGP